MATDWIALSPRLIALSLILFWVCACSSHVCAQVIDLETAFAAESESLRNESDNGLELLPQPQSPDWLGLTDNQENPESAFDDSPLPFPDNVVAPAFATQHASGVESLHGDAMGSRVSTAVGTGANLPGAVRTIPTVIEWSGSFNRVVRYDIPLEEIQIHRAFAQQGFEGRLVDVAAPDAFEKQSVGAKLQRLFSLKTTPKKTKVVRYDVPAEHIELHQEFAHYNGEIIEPGLLRLPEVRFFQPKARVFMDMKRENDGEFDLFGDGALLASLDVVELYFPMPLISDRFAHALGKTDRVTRIGWRFGATIGLGITTALSNGDSAAGSAPISTLSTGLRYEFPLGRPSNELITTRDPRLDQRTRVGFETGIQAGISANESLADATDYGWYFGILVNTPWNHYGG